MHDPSKVCYLFLLCMLICSVQFLIIHLQLIYCDYQGSYPKQIPAYFGYGLVSVTATIFFIRNNDIRTLQLLEWKVDIQ